VPATPSDTRDEFRDVTSLIRREDIAPADWTGMLRDGALTLVWHGVAIRAGHRITMPVRLAAMAPLVPRRGVNGRASAAWVYAGGPLPDKVDVVVPPGARHTDPHPRRRTVEAALPAAEVHDVPACGRITTVQRTGLDVARYAPREVTLRLLVGLWRRGFEPDAALDTLDAMVGARGVRQAREAIRTLTRVRPADPVFWRP